MKFNCVDELVEYVNNLSTPINELDINIEHNIIEETKNTINEIDLYFTSTEYVLGDNKLLVDSIHYINEGLLSFTFNDALLTIMHNEGYVNLPTNFGLKRFKLSEDKKDFPASCRCTFTP